MRIYILRVVKHIFFITPLWRYFLPRMKFDMTLEQLNFITQTIGGIKESGAVLEIGVGAGATSIMINEYLKTLPLRRDFYAVDTFYGFTKEDIHYEQSMRDKNDDYNYYRSNSLEWYKKTLSAHGFNKVKIFKADAKIFDYEKIGKLAFCLFDVDLFLPTEAVLPILYKKLVPGGVSEVRRISSPIVLAVLAIITTANSIVFCLATYMRAYREEPMLKQSLAVGFLVATAVYIGSKYGVLPMMILYMLICIFVSLPWAAWLYFGYLKRAVN